MRITITCPSCGKKSKISTDMEGKKLRCPYPDCRKSFCVTPAGEAYVPVEDQLLEAASDVPAWQAEPPPVRRGADTPAGPPQEVAWEPPVRRDPFDLAAAEQPVYADLPQEGSYAPADYQQPPVYQHDDQYHPHVSAAGRKRLIIIGGVIFVLLLVCGLLGFTIYQQFRQKEGKLADQAQKAYAEEKYADAQRMFQDLYEKFANSAERSRYQFMADLSELRAVTRSSGFSVEQAYTKVNTFVKVHTKKPEYREYRGDFWQALMAVAEATIPEAEKKSEAKVLDQAKDLLTRARDIGPGPKDLTTSEPRYADLDKKLAAAGLVIAASQAQKNLVDQLASLLKDGDAGSPGAVEKAQVLFEKAAKEHPRIAQDKELLKALEEFKSKEAHWVRYTPNMDAKELPRGPALGSSEGPTLAVCPLVKGGRTAAPPNDPVVLALARGILYALAQSNGEFRWAMRVGIDTHKLPLVLKANPPLPELALVLSAETKTLSAVETQTGKTLWHFRMEGSCPAGPILVGRQAFLPTAEGKLHVIDIIDGRLIGHYLLGQPLTVPGAYDPASRRLYLPAANKRIYMLDIESNQCGGVLYTGHTVGGLRGPPVIVGSSEGGDFTLVLSEATDLNTMKIRGFTPSRRDSAKPREYTLPGWSWFTPYFDGETLGFVTDRGRLGVFGLKRGTRDTQPVFELTPSGGLDVADQRARAAGEVPLGRAQVVQMGLNQWWLLIGGSLQRHRFDLYRQQVVPVPGETLELGTPLHDARLMPDQQRLVVVTQELDQPRCLATAVHNVQGVLQWQRQLGLVGAQTPLIMGEHFLAIDQSGGLFHLDLKSLPAQPKEEWVKGEDLVATGLDAGAPPMLLPSADGQAAVAVIYVRRTEQVVLRKYALGKGVSERVYRVESEPAGNAVLAGHSVLLPCRDGNLYEFPLEGANEVPVPLAWRDRNAGVSATCYAVVLGADQVLVGDGARKLQRWQLDAADKRWRKTQGAEIEWPARLATTPLILPESGGDRLICVADENGVVHLRSLTRGSTVQQWQIANAAQDGRILRGPFLRGQRIGCVIHEGGRDQVVMLDPRVTTPLWKYAGDPQGICGDPQQVGNLILVAELSGRFMWLDAESGREVGRNPLSTRVVPATAAVPVAPGLALAPMSDGSMLILTAPGK